MKITLLNIVDLVEISGGNNLGKTGPESQESVKAIQQMGKTIGDALVDAYDYCRGFINGLFS